MAERCLFKGGVMKEESSAPAIVAYSGFKIKIPYTANTVSIYEIMMTDADDVDFFADLTALPEPATTYAALGLGEFCTDSTFGQTASRAALNNGWPDVNASSGTYNPSENSSSSSSGMEIYVRPAEDRTLKEVYIALNTYYGDATQFVQFTDDQDNEIPFISGPADKDDFVQTATHSYLFWYKWTF